MNNININNNTVTQTNFDTHNFYIMMLLKFAKSCLKNEEMRNIYFHSIMFLQTWKQDSEKNVWLQPPGLKD